MLDWLLGKKSPNERSTKALLRQIDRYLRDPKAFRPEREPEKRQAQEAMLALASRPFSEEILELAIREAPLGPLHAQATQVLGLLGHPKAAAALVDLLSDSSRGGYHKEIVPILGHPRNESAVPALSKIAAESENFHIVKLAVEALEAIGTVRAEQALQDFRSRPSRRIHATYFETPEPAYTSAFGQVPTEAELAEALPSIRDKAKGAYWISDYVFTDDAYLRIIFDRLMASPSEDGAARLETFLDFTQDKLRDCWLTTSYKSRRKVARQELIAYPSIATNESVRVLVERAAAQLPRRQQFLRSLLQAETRARLETAIGRALKIA